MQLLFRIPRKLHHNQICIINKWKPKVWTSIYVSFSINPNIAIIAVENDKYNPTLELAMRLAKYLNTTIEELFTLE